MLRIKRCRVLALTVALVFLFTSVAFAAVPKPQYVYFQSGNDMVKVDYAKAVDDAMNDDNTLYDAVKQYVGAAELGGTSVVVETDTGSVIDYQKVLGEGKRIAEVVDDPAYATAKPEPDKELRVENGQAVIGDIRPEVVEISSITATETLGVVEIVAEGTTAEALWAAITPACTVAAKAGAPNTYTVTIQNAAYDQEITLQFAAGFQLKEGVNNKVKWVDPQITIVEAAEEAVAAYEAAPYTTLAEIAAAEALEVTANEKVALVADADVKADFEARIAAQKALVDAKKAELEAVVAAAESAVAAYEAASYTNLEEVAAAEALEAAANEAVALVVDADIKDGLAARIAAQKALVDAAKVTLLEQAADAAVDELEAAVNAGLGTIDLVNAAYDLKVAAETAIAALPEGNAKIAALTERVNIANTAIVAAAVNAVNAAATLKSLLAALQSPALELQNVNPAYIADYRTARDNSFTRTVAEIQTNVIDAVNDAHQQADIAAAIDAVMTAVDPDGLMTALQAQILGLANVNTDYANAYLVLRDVYIEELGDGTATVEGIQQNIVDAAPVRVQECIDAVNNASSLSNLLNALKADELGIALTNEQADVLGVGNFGEVALPAQQAFVQSISDILFATPATSIADIQGIVDCVVATTAVVAAETAVETDAINAQDEHDAAKALVDLLADSTIKTQLTNRLAAVQAAIDEAVANNELAAATAAVEAVETALRDLITDGTISEPTAVNLTVEVGADEIEAGSYATAVASVDALPAGEGKGALQERLQVANALIQARQAEAATGSLDTVELFTAAITEYNEAVDAINALPEIAMKQLLLDSIAGSLGKLEDNAETAVATLEDAVAAIQQETPTQELVDAANALVPDATGKVDALPAAAAQKQDLDDRVSAAQAAIALGQATVDVIAAEDGALGTPAEIAATTELYNTAVASVSALAASDAKTALEERLVAVKEAIDTAAAGLIAAVNNATTAAEMKDALEALGLTVAVEAEAGLFLQVYGDVTYTSIEAIQNDFNNEIKLVYPVNAAATAGDMDTALLALDYAPYINLGSTKRPEVAVLFYTTHNPAGGDETVFESVAEVKAAIDNAITQYNALIAAVNNATTIYDMRVALQAIVDTDAFTLVNITDPVTNTVAETVLNNKVTDNTTYDTIKAIDDDAQGIG